MPAKHPDFVDEVFVQFPSGHSTVFAIVDNVEALAWVANLGCIELHTWHSRVPEIERPDYLLIDLDPTTDGQWPLVREIARVVREVMDELGLRSYPKTSGATGLHILAPIKPDLLFPDVRRFAKALAMEVERRIDDVSLARRFEEVGLEGFVLKSHYGSTAERAAVVRGVVPGVKAMGALVLNQAVGGMNALAPEDWR